jgi:thiol-disulfide isomerase/thioredoxin
MKFALWFLFAVACSTEAPAPKAQRFDAVPAVPEKVSLEAWCDQYPSADAAKSFPWPNLDTPAPTSGKPAWVNIWATWCAPCVAEMPRLVAWQKKMAQEGVEADLLFVSVDEKTTDLERFYKQHPDFPPTLHLADPSQLVGWLPQVGLDANAAIPLHFFLDAQGRMRCERSGGVGDSDYAEAKAALTHG